MKDDKVYINQIVEAISKVELFVGDLDKASFLSDLKTQSAVTAIDLPWQDIAGFRNRAIHEYFEIDLGVVWTTIKEDLQVLRQKLEAFL